MQNFSLLDAVGEQRERPVVLKRGMFTLDFDIRKEIEKTGSTLEGPPGELAIKFLGENIIGALEEHPLWSCFRYVVTSGNGMHVHYFGEPATVVKEQWVTGMRHIFEEIAAITPIPPDFGCGNAGRIMRMPGSWNVKSLPPKPVDFLVWQTGVSLPPLQFVQERGERVRAQQVDVRAQAAAEFEAKHPEGGSDVIGLISQIPIEQVVFQLLGCKPKPKQDNGMRFIDGEGKERG